VILWRVISLRGETPKLLMLLGSNAGAAIVSAGSTTKSPSVKHAFRAIRCSPMVSLVIKAMACVTEQVFYFNYKHMNISALQSSTFKPMGLFSCFFRLLNLNTSKPFCSFVTYLEIYHC
jgi:hypothetical protein